MSENAVTDAAEEDLQAKKEERIREFKKERGVVWISKAAAAKRAGISRVTLDSWISSNVLPVEAVLIEGPRKVQIDADELDRIASARKLKKPGEAKRQAQAAVDAKDAQIRRLEAENYQLNEQIDTLKTSQRLIEGTAEKRIEEKETAYERERELAAKVETELRNQLAKAEARAEAAEREAKKGVLRKMFS
jgi:hypothetical protein